MVFVSLLSKSKTTLFTGLAICLLFSSLKTNAQGSAWNSNSFKVSKDFTPLQNMSGATNITFSGNLILSSPSIPVGFNFRYGLSSFSNCFVSPYGFIKFGGNIISNNPDNDTSVIVPLYNGTSWNASYLTVGSAPNRKMVIQYIGVMQPSGEPTSYQIWLHERTGKIQFVYEELRGYYGYSNAWNYKIFCQTNILNKKTAAALKINPNNAPPTVNYAATVYSFDSIYANTRFTFEPDTIKPAVPAFLNFTNVQAGCTDVNIGENSTNESVIVLERADNGTNYLPEKFYYTTSAAGATTYTYQQTVLQPFWNYAYRTFVSNGFLNSDTIYNTVQTLMPQINGVKTVPGDYPTITALLQDAACKHLGPNLVIELQNNYSFAAETLPVTFSPSLQTRLIQSVTIRPAANANITWAASTVGALFYVDSVRHVFLDGRPGGIGTAQNFTIFQQNPQSSAIQYTNTADSGGINYCRIIKKNSNSFLSYAVVVVPLNHAYNFSKKDINAFSITNSFFSADSATVSDFIYVKPADTLQARDFVINGNQFSRFRRSAVHFEGGGENLEIRNNRFYQPVSFTPQIFLPYTHASCLTLINNGKITVDNNYFGGSGPTWGTGKFILNSASSNFSFINYENNSLTKKAFITNNKFGNIACTGYTSSGNKLIYVYKGDVVIANNQFGTADSSNSITNSEYFWGIDMFYGTKTVSNNFFSGFQGGYQTAGTANYSYFITTSFTDSCAFTNNDIGGSNNPAANSSSGVVTGIYVSSTEKNITLKNNNIRGISSSNRSVIAVSGSNGLSNVEQVKVEIDGNTIHHIQSISKVYGIDMLINSTGISRISNNHIYALKTAGTAPGNYGPEGTVYGINCKVINFSQPVDQYKGEVRIYGNKIHSFESARTLSNSGFSHYGIVAVSPVSRIYNNEIRFGIDSKGQPVDSLTVLNGIVIAPVDYQSFLSDKHYIEHNTLYFGGKGNMGSAISATYSYNYVSPKNSLTITNNILNIERIPLTGTTITPDIYTDVNYIQSFGAKNLWYSSTIPNTPALLQSYKQACHCDSSSFTGNPVFLNPAGDSSNYNLHLGALSKADSAGTPPVTPVATDLDNNNRNAYSPVDIGCYSATPCGTGVFPSITITNPVADSIQLCGGNTITLTSSISGGTFTSLQWQRNLIDSAGATSTSLTVNVPGNYRLIGKTACGQVASRMIYVTNDPVQASVTISTPNTGICSGTAVTFTATPGAGAVSPSYQWQVNGVNAGTNSNSFTTSSLSNNAQVKVIMSVAGCGSVVTGTSNIITMTVTPAPVANAGSDITLCGGATGQLNGSGGTSYSWSPATGLSNPAIANPIVTATATTNYILTVTNGGNCTSQDTVKVIVAQPAAPAVSIAVASNTICAGSAASFTATPVNGGTNPSYQWQVNGVNAGTNSNTFITSALTNNAQVKVILTSNAACATTATVTSNIITMTSVQLATPLVSLSGRVFTVTNPDAGATYTWQTITNGAWANTVPAATGITYTAPGAGEYRVMAVKGPCTAYSVPQQTNGRIQSGYAPYGIYIYPNPANNIIIIDSIPLIQKWEIMDILHEDGRAALPAFDIKNKSVISVNIMGLSAGIYFVRMKRNDGEFVFFKFVKQ